MAISLDTASSRLLANAAAVATAMAGGTTTAEVQAISEFLKTMSIRNDIAIPAMSLGLASRQGQLKPNKG
jgi:hypothetical protein